MTDTGKSILYERGRFRELQSFLDAMEGAFKQSVSHERTRACFARVAGRLRQVVPSGMAAGRSVQASAVLDAALEPARNAGGALGKLAEHISRLDPMLTWRSRGDDAGEAAGIASTMIVGPGGLEDRGDVWVGLSLVPPATRYPEHRHPPEEIYLFLTGGLFRHGESGWFAPGIGGTLYNEPDIVHTMEAPASAPLLALWCLFDQRHPFKAD